MYLNKAIIIGNLTRDPEIRSLPSGIKVANFGVATNRVWKDSNGEKKEGTDFHNIVVFGKQAEIASSYLKKGRSVMIEGRIQNRSWDGPDGQKKYRSEIVVDKIQFGPRTDGGGQGFASSGGSSSPLKTDGADKDKSKGDAIDYPHEEINAEDIPF
ncbi:MAG: single-stranded DNA-binding protein [Candidatus Taylorbacteria bacterium RIFCSPLOWO2_12_FULL_47_20]|uniref:Single-stranded DNA-binding protein n=1 Tax=Candidatus Taylorbacteria bacterium RIFCSPLOWO2_12_FULL_47_20 TaxID=1802335 RepID=A0A1G2PBC2_9BACT|nr:MAG: single-stranded DNA-binding protein [Candidatus Taylorbacteria bacterium RIFCSPLOWO2_12_FULL_47_20]